jgi:hypothetical protein
MLDLVIPYGLSKADEQSPAHEESDSPSTFGGLYLRNNRSRPPNVFVL